MKKKILEGGFFVLGAYIGIIGFNIIKDYTGFIEWLGVPLTVGQEIGMSIFVAMTVGYIFFQLTQTVTEIATKTANRLVAEMKSVSAPKLVLGIIGLILGFIIAFLCSMIYIRLFENFISTGLTIITYVTLGYFGVMLMSDRTSEILNHLNPEGKITSLRNKRAKQEATPKIIDTSVIIDGRVVSILEEGFMEGKIIIPEFVLLELQHLADSGDDLKRRRGKRGLGILERMKKQFAIEIYTSDDKVLDEIPEVDMKLVKLAQIIKGKLVTNDYNLNKVAKIKDVPVLNINQLANSLRPVVLPEEIIEVKLVREGTEAEQGIAYLEDGTLIVVEDAKEHIGKKAKIRVTKVMQTRSGRMIFGRFIKTVDK